MHVCIDEPWCDECTFDIEIGICFRCVEYDFPIVYANRNLFNASCLHIDDLATTNNCIDFGHSLDNSTASPGSITSTSISFGANRATSTSIAGHVL